MDKLHYQQEIDKARGNPALLEELFSQVCRSEMQIFTEAIVACADRYPDDILLRAWVARLLAKKEKASVVALFQDSGRRWLVATGIGMMLGLLFMALTHGSQPIPFAVEDDSFFWVMWPSLFGISILFYLYFASDEQYEIKHFSVAGLMIAIIAGIAAARARLMSGDSVLLLSFHLPLVIWAIIGVAIVNNYSHRALQVFAFIKKSIEAIVVGGIFLITCGIFFGLVTGIFEVLTVHIADTFAYLFFSWGIGMVLMLSVAFVYHPEQEPVRQELDTGIGRILALITRFFLPLVVIVLFAYVVYFIPTRFWEGFQNREVLAVYNATLVAIMFLLILLPGSTRARATLSYWLLRGMQAVVGLSLLLNIYALSAVGYRIVQWGITPNRHMVAGLNVVTLLMLILILISLLRSDRMTWHENFKAIFAKVSLLPVVWALWMILVAPIFI